MQSPIAVIKINNLDVKIKGNFVLQDLNLTIYPRRIVSIIGDSGSGKTTLMRAILKLQPITNGSITLAGENIALYNSDDISTKLILSNVGVMFQQSALFSSLNVLNNVMVPLKEYTNFSQQTIMELAFIKLKLVGLMEGSYYKYPKEISPGMQRRVALARALALDPKILFLDEPTTGLDPRSAGDMDELIFNLYQQLNLTIIMISHDVDSICNISNEIVYVADKKIGLHDTLENAINCTTFPKLSNYFKKSRVKLV
jgi:phospholipid/cholesterol/gamma-HCH transport system ATP-binding protein